ncbi:MAG: DinB family protein [Acidobacteria bacterium]|jgi:uncharacterized damage-inducible protein DinB|nr:DinB family protein [Acidobacteriota bacterium]
MTITEALELFAYGSWANERVFTAADELSRDDLVAVIASSFPSVRETLGHIVVAEWVWLRHWRGESPKAMPTWVTGSSLGDLKAQLATVEAERSEYLAGLTDAALDEPCAYRTLAGEARNDVLGGLMRHVVNHSSYHRGQVATQLRHLGRTPPTTDLIAYLRMKK